MGPAPKSRWVLPAEAVAVGTDFVPASLDASRAAFGIGAAGATLVRPDGYVAWRATTMPDDAEHALGSAIAQVAFATHA